MSLAELSQLHVLISRASGPQDVFPVLAGLGSSADMEQPIAVLLEEVEKEYERLTRIAAPERFKFDANAQSSARWLLTRLYELHRQALELLGVPESDADDHVPQQAPAPSPSASAANRPRQHVAAAPRTAPQAAPARDEAPGADAAADDDEASAADAVSFTITTPRGGYKAERRLAEGELSTVYLGKSTRPAAGADDGAQGKLVLKIALERGDNDLLLDEVRTLRLFAASPSPQHKHLPTFIDQFQTPDGRAGTVLGFVPGYTFPQIKKRHPQGLQGEHGIWIMRRLLSVLGYAHNQGVIHGNLSPEHILVSPPDHNVVLLDWSYSVVAPARTGQRFKVYNPDFSAPEVAERKPPIPASDLYSLGRCMIAILGGSLDDNSLPPQIDERLARFIQFFVRASPRQRAQDAWEMYEKLKALREEIYGPHQFLELKM